MLIRLMVCFESSSAVDVSLAQSYWQLDQAGKWSYTVAQLASHFSVSSGDISARIALTAPAFLLSRLCKRCHSPFRFRNRTEYASSLKDQNGLCSDCLQREVNERNIIEQRRLNALRERQQSIWIAATSEQAQFDYASLSFRDSIYAYALYIGTETDSDGEIRSYGNIPYSPDGSALTRITLNLRRLRLLKFGELTPAYAFTPGEEEDSFHFDPDQVSWRFARSKVSGKLDTVGNELRSNIARGMERSDAWETICALWWELGKADAFQSLNENLSQYRLRAEHGPKLDEALTYALSKYSIPQVRFFTWKLARDTAAYASKTTVVRSQAIHSISGNLVRTCERYLANSWPVKPYVQQWDSKESLLTTTLFDSVLGTGETGFRTLNGDAIADRING